MERQRFAGALVGAALGEAIGARWDGLPRRRLWELAPGPLLPGRGELLDAWDDPAALVMAVQRRRWLRGGDGAEGWFAAVLAGDAGLDAVPGDDALAVALDAASRAIARGDRPREFAQAMGWRKGVPGTFADTAAAAVVCAHAHPDDTVEAIEAAVRLGGATRRTAALTGALVGAARGPGAVRMDLEHRMATVTLGQRVSIGLSGGTLDWCGDGLATSVVAFACWTVAATVQALPVLVAIAAALVPLTLVTVVVISTPRDCCPPSEMTELQMGEISKRIELYTLKKGTPDSLQEVYGDMDVPKDAWGNDFGLVVPGPDGRAYDLVSYGSDGVPGGAGNAEDIWLSEHRR